MRTQAAQSNRVFNNPRGARITNDQSEYSSLKRNLFNVFNNLSNNDENLKKDTIDEITNSQVALEDVKQLSSWKEEQKINMLECMSPLHHDSLKYHPSLVNSLTPTPLKRNGFYESKDWVPHYPSLKDNFQRGRSPNANYPPFLLMNKDKFSPHASMIADHQFDNNEFCGKKRLRYESCYSDESPRNTHKNYEQYSDNEEQR